MTAEELYDAVAAEANPREGAKMIAEAVRSAREEGRREGWAARLAEALRDVAFFGKKAPSDPLPGSAFSPPCWCDVDDGEHRAECVAALRVLAEYERSLSASPGTEGR